MDVDFLKQEIDYELNKFFTNKKDFNKIIYESMNYSLSIGGKRIRPILFLYTYLLFKDNYKDVIEFSCYIEMIHTYSLIHDDLPSMDNDMLRRGHLTNHIKFSEAIAILAGDGLLTEAFKQMIEFSIKKGNRALYATYAVIKGVDCEGMIGGQVVDVVTKGRGLTDETLNYINRNKTAALIKSSILSAAYLGEATEEEMYKLSKYGEYLGLIFQIIDDILDKTTDSKTLGKTANSDEINNKFTYVDLYGIEKCKELCDEYNNRALNILKSLDRDVSYLLNFTKIMLDRKF